MRRVLLILLLLLAAAGCMPSPAEPPHTGSVEGMIYQAFGPVGDQAVRVAVCESGLNPGATNGQYQGVFQLGNHFEWIANKYGGTRYDAWANVQAAAEIYSDSGWGPWTCKP